MQITQELLILLLTYAGLEIANFNYRQGVAFQCLARHTDALAAFANGLAQDPKSPQLLDGLVEAAMKSPLKPTLEPTYR